MSSAGSQRLIFRRDAEGKNKTYEQKFGQHSLFFSLLEADGRGYEMGLA
jgi:hypothetical protein